jgi:hypothetical protein
MSCDSGSADLRPDGAASDSADRTRGDLAEHLPGLLQTAGVARVEIDVLTKRPSFHGADVSERAREVTGPAREEHERRHFGFWEFVLSEAVDVDRETRRGLLEGALRHFSGESIRMSMGVADFTASLRAGHFSALPPRTIVSLCSPVDRKASPDDVEVWHLPMLDLGVPVGPKGEAAAVDALESLNLFGLLFDSGKSFHFFSASLITGNELWALIGRAQLLAPIVDARWASHQLIDGRCSLRISTDVDRHPKAHRLVAYL